MRQRLNKIAACPLLPTLTALMAKLKLEESAVTATTLLINRAISCEEDELVGNQTADVQLFLKELERLKI